MVGFRLMLFRPWRGGSRQMVFDDYLAALVLPVLVIVIGRQEALLFETPSSLMSLLCITYTFYLIHSKNRWPRAPSSSAVLAVLASVLAVSITFVPGPRINAWLTALVGLTALNFYRYLLELAWREFRASFTPGELLLLAQSAAMLIFSTVMELLKYTQILKYHEALFTHHDMTVTMVTVVSRSTVACAMFVFVASSSSPQHFVQYLTAAILYGTGHVTVTLGGNPVAWFLQFISEEGRVPLIVYWLFVLVCCLPILLYYRNHVTDVTSRDQTSTSSRNNGPSTITRKFFHLVILSIFMPALMWDVPLLYVGSSVGLAGLVVLETFRLHDVPPIGHVVSDLFSSFRDRQDRGKLLLTPIYLLVACACPVWLCGGDVRRGEDPPLVVFLGLMSVGVGDAAAAIVGSKFGMYTPTLSGIKTLAGLVAGLCSQFIFWLVLFYHGVPGEHCVMPVVILVSTLTETFTGHVDNLVIPVYTVLTYTLLENGVHAYRSTLLSPG